MKRRSKAGTPSVWLKRFLPFHFFSIFLLPVYIFSGGALCIQAMQPGPQAQAPVRPAPVLDDINIEKNRTVESDVISVGHSIFIDGEAKQSVTALGGSVTVNGKVGGDVASMGGDVWLGPEAVVEGDLIVLGGKLYHDPRARVAGKTLATTYFQDELRRTFSQHQNSVLAQHFERNALLWRMARILAWFIIAVLVILFIPVQTAFAMDRFERDFAKISVIGLLALIVFIGLLALFSLMIKIVIGIPLVFLLILLLFSMWAFGAVTFYLTIGRVFVRWLLKRPLPLALYALLGLILWSLLSFIPVVNWFIPYLVFIFALGISLATKFGTGKPWFVRAT
ncbi:MAG: hypothetical protein LAO31_10935 [Acidobacteriia bacterium]|nr:hypothetical protein [Terriglobia bacterium]